MRGFFDIHHHLVYGLDDDGPRTPEDMHRMIIHAVRDGITDLIATPHVMPGIRPFDQALYLERLEEARTYIREAGLNLTLYPGAEIYYTPFTCEHLAEGKVSTLAWTNHVLVEFEPGISYPELHQSCRELAQAGFVPVLAHTERYKCLVRVPSRIAAMKKEFPLLVQVNASIFLKQIRFQLARFLSFAIKRNLLDFVASDAHGISNRVSNLMKAYDAMHGRYNNRLADSLLHGHAKLNLYKVAADLNGTQF